MTAASTAAERNPGLEWIEEPGDPGKVYLEAKGLPPTDLRRLESAGWTQGQWQKLLSIYAEQSFSLAALIDLPAMMGDYSIVEGKLRFTPAFPLAPGVTYRAVFRGGELPVSGAKSAGLMLGATYRLPVKPAPPSTIVRAIYPSADELPENLLKFYVHFSAPMSRGGIYEHIQLLTGQGEAVELPFLEIDEELWNAGMTRLTLFIDPGRIKRGVKPIEEIGPALEAGKDFTLLIDQEWKDANGAPLLKGFAKTFRVTAPDRTQPDAASWRIDPPSAGTTEPLIVQFGESMDHALATRLIWLAGPESDTIPGNVVLENAERVWRFTPEAPWRSGAYQLSLASIIEDLAGNSVGKRFEVDLFKEVKPPSPKVVRLPLDIR